MSTPEPRDLVPRPAPPPGQTRLRRRLADRYDFRDALLAAMAERDEPTGGTVGGRLDVAGDDTVVLVAELWSRMADSVAAYTELTAGERYLATAQDWTDLRRTTDLLGHKPSQRVAAHGWIRCTTDTGASPVVPAGTQVQAPGTPTRPAQTFEVSADTQLRADWADLTVTGVPQPVAPTGASIRMLEDPDFHPADRVLLVQESLGASPTQPTDWGTWLKWIRILLKGGFATDHVVGTVTVKKRTDDLGAFLITMDRPLDQLLGGGGDTTYAAYRIRAELDLAQRLTSLSYVSGTQSKTTTPAIDYTGEDAAVMTTQLLVTDASAATPGMGIVIWNHSGAHITTVASVNTKDWSVAPGLRHRVGVLGLAESIGNAISLIDGDLNVALIDARKVAQNYDLPSLGAGQTRLRVHPRPSVVPERIAVQTDTGWQLATCSLDAHDTTDDQGGRLLALGTGFTAAATVAPATANLVPIQHGSTQTAPMTLSGSTTIVPGPVTGDVDPGGAVTDSLTVHVDGVRFDEVPSLYGRDPSEPVYSVKIGADGQLVLTFGDGVHGAQPRGEVTGLWRLGGGLVGELDAPLIDTLLGSVRGVRKIAGVGRTTGAADQEDQWRMRQAAAARIRALDRAVSMADLADLALAVPGTSHSAAWRGAGPTGCPCGRVGLHLAFLRATESAARAPQPVELAQMAGFLDARRDTSVGLCVCAGVASPLALTLAIAIDPRREVAAVRDAVTAAVTDPRGALSPVPRTMGVPLDASDVVKIAQPVLGVLGIVTLTLASGLRSPSTGEAVIGRTPAERYELLSVGSLTVVPA